MRASAVQPSAWPIAGGHVAVALVVGTLAHAGVARHVACLARALRAGRHRAQLYVLAGPAEPAAERLRALGLPTTVLARRRSYEAARIVALARAFKRDGIDLVHAILPAGAAYGALAARLAGVPIVIVSSRAGDPQEGRRIRAWLHRIYRGATAVVANTRAQARRVAAEAGLAAERVTVVYDGVDLARHPAPGVLGALRDRVWHRPLVIGGAGARDGGRELFCATAARIVARHPDAHFVWLEERDAVSRADGSAGVPLSVVSVADDPEPVLRQLALLCLAGGPEVALDLVPAAMAAARPVVAAAVPGIDELVVDGTMGAVVPPDDPEALSAAAIGFLEDRQRLRTAGHAARAHAERAHDAEAMGRMTAALYEASLLGALPLPGETAVG
jgi:glycosyltransferase involved in cell wall biosynthesis